MTTAVKDRRRTPRAMLSLPVRIRPVDVSLPEEICATQNISRDGISFVTSEKHYCRDMKLYVTRNFHPNDLTNLEEQGTVERVERQAGGKWAVTIRIAKATS